jgi:hypothetical protein
MEVCTDRFPVQVGIQFVQIGNSLLAAEFLQELDDGLTSNHGIRVSQAVFRRTKWSWYGRPGHRRYNAIRKDRRRIDSRDVDQNIARRNQPESRPKRGRECHVLSHASCDPLSWTTNENHMICTICRIGLFSDLMLLARHPVVINPNLLTRRFSSSEVILSWWSMKSWWAQGIEGAIRSSAFSRPNSSPSSNSWSEARVRYPGGAYDYLVPSHRYELSWILFLVLYARQKNENGAVRWDVPRISAMPDWFFRSCRSKLVHPLDCQVVAIHVHNKRYNPNI